MRPSSFVAPVLIASLLSACGGSDGPTAPGGNANPGGGNGSASVKDDPSFSADIVPIFSQLGCASGGCHAPPGEAGLVLSTSPYNALVNVASTQTGELRVIPGNATDSYLIKKLEGRAGVGQRMPVGGQIGSTELANLKNWINKGAKNN
ncbi:MAG: hypothetical protein ACYC6F_10995 [Longimicrobiales bacterium]